MGEEGRNAQGVCTQTEILVRWKALVRVKTTSGQIGICQKVQIFLLNHLLVLGIELNPSLLGERVCALFDQ